ncbi:MAG: hypothetical protein IH937_09685 [Acidobacteria bacterium]|nr:hypothetical protein [Acidobacteriota bacterium]
MRNKTSLLGRFLLTLLAIGFFFITASSLCAQGGAGVRVGLSIDPEQFYFGGHLDAGPIGENLWFRPNLEIGIGDDITLIGLNMEFTYWIPLQSSLWNIYFGAGPAINFFVGNDGPGRSDKGVEAGFNLLVGLAHYDGFFTELKVGALDSPDLKFGVGYSWK